MLFAVSSMEEIVGLYGESSMSATIITFRQPSLHTPESLHTNFAVHPWVCAGVKDAVLIPSKKKRVKAVHSTELDRQMPSPPRFRLFIGQRGMGMLNKVPFDGGRRSSISLLRYFPTLKFL